MIKKFFIAALLIGLVSYFSYDYIVSGKLEKFINNNAGARWAPGSMYYLGMLFLFFQQYNRAEAPFIYVMEKYGESSPYYENSLYQYFHIASIQNHNREAVRRGNIYLKEFPDSEYSALVERRIHVMRSFIN